MEKNLQDFQTGMSALAEARKSIDEMCSSLKKSMQIAKESNDFGKFKKCCGKIELIIKDMEDIGKDVWSAAVTLQKMCRILSELEGN